MPDPSTEKELKRAHKNAGLRYVPPSREVRVYFDFADWWIGYYRGPNHHYVCPLPSVVIRWKRRYRPGSGDGN